MTLKNSQRWRFVTLTLAVVVALLGGIVLIGWLFDLPRLKSVFSGLVSMKVNTSLGLLLCGVGLTLMTNRRLTYHRYVVLGLSVFVFALGALTLSEYLGGWQLGIDQWIFQEAPTAIGTSHPGRMSPASAFNFVVVAIALFVTALPGEFKLRYAIITSFATTLILVGLLALLGYFTEWTLSYHLWNYTATALHTAVGFTLFGLGLLTLVRDKQNLKWVLDSGNTVAFVVVIALMIFATGGAYNFAKRLLDSAAAVEQSHVVLEEIQKVSTDFERLQRGQRGYVITGASEELTLFTESTDQLTASLLNL
jgi:hypothetical protein